MATGTRDTTATTTAPHSAGGSAAPRLGRARAWVQGLGQAFERVALFQIEGTEARLVAAKSIAPRCMGETISLLDQTPLRWAVEAGSPLVSAGRGPGGLVIPASLGLTPPRGFVVIPLVVNRQMVALAYADNGRKPLPIATVGDVFAFCARVQNGENVGDLTPAAVKPPESTPASPAPTANVRPVPRAASRERAAHLRRPTLRPATPRTDAARADEPRPDETRPDRPAAVKVQSDGSLAPGFGRLDLAAADLGVHDTLETLAPAAAADAPDHREPAAPARSVPPPLPKQNGNAAVAALHVPAWVHAADNGLDENSSPPGPAGATQDSVPTLTLDAASTESIDRAISEALIELRQNEPTLETVAIPEPLAATETSAIPAPVAVQAPEPMAAPEPELLAEPKAITPTVEPSPRPTPQLLDQELTPEAIHAIAASIAHEVEHGDRDVGVDVDVDVDVDEDVAPLGGLAPLLEPQEPPRPAPPEHVVSAATDARVRKADPRERAAAAWSIPATEAPGGGPRPLAAHDLDVVVTPQGIRRARENQSDRRRPHWIAALCGVAAALLALVPLTPASPPSGPRYVRVPPGATVSEVAADLHRKALIRNPTAFEALSRLSGLDRGLRAGTYTLPTGSWAWTVLRELTQGRVQTKTVTLPEGLTLLETANALAFAGLVDLNRFLREARNPELLKRYGIASDSVEGFLFPETYTFAVGVSEQEIITYMIEEFFTRLGELPAAEKLTPSERQQAVTLASLVEREARDKAEAPRIAGVFKNRLSRNMRLESCATIQYILGRPKARLRLDDLRIESPYNTYLHEGLPPGPIANPSLAAVKAVLHPETHEFLFFVAKDDGSGRHTFTKTFAAHQAAQKKRKTPVTTASR